MSESGAVPLCPHCGQPSERDYAAEPKGGHVFNPYEAASMGCPRWELKNSFRDKHGNLVRKRPDGSLKILCPAGIKHNPKTGNPVVESRRQMNWMHKTAGLKPNR